MNKMLRALLGALLVLPALAAGTAAYAAQAAARNYAVVSVMGDKMDVVVRQPVVGSLLDRNSHSPYPVKGGVFDQGALLATGDAINRADAQARVTLLAVTAQAFFDDQERFFAGQEARLPEALVATLKQQGATHLVLITKHRGEASMKLDRESLGNGKIEGLGFYMDPSAVIDRASTTGENGRGLFSPFVYIKLTLIDLADNRIMRNSVITGTRPATTTDLQKTAALWDAMTPETKVKTLQEIIDAEIALAMPRLLAGN